jgi:hypothetical protein
MRNHIPGLKLQAETALLADDMKCRFAVWAVILWVSGLAGCATSHHANPLPPPVIVGKPASLDFILVNATNTLPDLQTETTELQDAIVSGLRETGLFADLDVIAPKEVQNGGIKILATIKQINKVSKSARVWYGGLAGRARVVVRVEISDLVTGTPIEEITVEGHTKAAAGAGLTDEAIQLAALQVVDEIKKLNVQKAQSDIEHGRLF